MQRVSLFVALCLLGAVFADPINYAGSTVTGLTWNVPDWTFDSTTGTYTCTPQTTTAVRYQAFNATLTTTQFVRILAMFQAEFLDTSPQLFLYTADQFNPATPCTGFGDAFQTASGAPPIDLTGTVPAGTYTVVVSGTSVDAAGLFAVNVIPATLSGNNLNNSQQWLPPLSGDVLTSCTTSDQSTDPARYVTLSWVPTESGNYDFEALVVPQNISTSYPAIAVYTGAFPNGTTSPAPFCQSGLVAAYVGSSNQVILASVPITAGVTYTIVVSGSDLEESGNVGIFVNPTRFGDSANSNATYIAPELPALSTAPNCSLTSNLKQYSLVWFTATEPVYIIDTGRESEFDTAVFLYAGVYTTVPPETCAGYILGGDTGDGGPIAVSVVPGLNYTAVVTGYGSGSGEWELYVVTGLPLGVTATTTGTGTGLTTNGVSTGASTGNGSDATSAVASMLLVAVACVLAMF